MSTRAQVSALLNDLDQTNARVNLLQKEFNDLDELAREYDRQSVTQAANGDYTNSTISAGRRDSTVIDRNAKKGDLDTAKARQSQLQSDYNTALATLSPEEQAAAKAEEVLKQTQAEASKASFMQGTTKYLIYGTIALVIVIGVIIVLRKKLAA
jgi:chromosome segregation ATPase